MVALELQELTKAWTSIRIQVDLTVEPGNLLALAGPSGCGKSTVLRMIAGLCTPDSGRVMIDGIDVTALSPKDREVGMVFQDYALFPHLDVLANVAYGLTVRGIPKKKRESLALDLLASVGMGSFSKRRPSELSGGERQRIALARTLATRPRVVLFDEPLSSLDTVLRKHLRLEIRELQKKAGLTALYVTHDLEEAMTMADQVAVMENGSILQCAPPRELWLKPSSAAVARFLGSGPCLPVLGFERSEKAMIAITEAGRFGIPHELMQANQGKGQSQGQSVAPLNDEGLPPTAHIFFERTAAKALTQEEARQVCVQDGYGLFSASCERTDFAGDVVDCMMRTGHEIIPLRLPPERAPVPGEMLQFRVATEKVHLIRT
jgi:ABC-type Fe3+/spermidine/putrescine transport system ATPase subunit